MYAFYKKYEYYFIALFVLITQLAVLPNIVDRYPDTDNYTHARRVLDLIASKNWAEAPSMHANYPFGEILHFTRITDVFWLLFSLPIFLFYPLKEAVFFGGFIFQTGVLVLSALALLWALKPIVPPVLRLVGVTLFFLQSSVSETYILIKPDHHALTALFCFATTGALIHFLTSEKMRYLKWAGFFAGLGLWTSIEGILIAYGLLASLSLLFLCQKVKAKELTLFSFFFFISSFACLVINPPYEGFFSPDNGRLSFLFVLVTGFTTLAMFILSALEEKELLPSFIHRGLALFVLASLFVGGLFLIFPPEVVFLPYFPSFIQEVWAKNVAELQPSTNNLTLFMLGSSASFLGLLVSVLIYRFSSEKQKKLLVLFFIPLLGLTILSLTSVRYGRLSALFSVFSLVIAFSVRLEKYHFSTRQKSVALSVVYILFVVYLSMNYRSINQIFLAGRPSVGIVKPYLPQGEGSVLTDTFMGPEVIWELDEKVIGGPYHRNIEGIADNFWLLEGQNQETTLYLLKKHRVKAILLYQEIPGQPYLFYDMNQRYSYLSRAKQSDTLVSQLITGRNIPCGIEEELNTPPPFLMFRVDFSKCQQSEEPEKEEEGKASEKENQKKEAS